MPSVCVAPPVPKTNLTLGDVKAVAAKYGVDPRTIPRWADAGVISYGVKLSAARRWNMAEIDDHIAAGCPKISEWKRLSK